MNRGVSSRASAAVDTQSHTHNHSNGTGCHVVNATNTTIRPSQTVQTSGLGLIGYSAHSDPLDDPSSRSRHTATSRGSSSEWYQFHYSSSNHASFEIDKWMLYSYLLLWLRNRKECTTFRSWTWFTPERIRKLWDLFSLPRKRPPLCTLLNNWLRCSVHDLRKGYENCNQWAVWNRSS